MRYSDHEQRQLDIKSGEELDRRAAPIGPEIAESLRIADKHLAGESADRRKALALDIAEAIVRHAGVIANDAIVKAFNKARANFSISPPDKQA